MLHSIYKHKAQLIIIMISCLALCYMVFQDGYPIGYDYTNQIIAYDAVKEQIDNGEIYPRWLSNVNSGMGGANLFFYPPLTYYTSYLIDKLSFNIFTTTQIMTLNACLFLLLSGISFYIFALRIITPDKSCVMAIIYMSLPYHLWFEIYERNAIADFYSYIFIPLIFYCIRVNMFKDKIYIIGFILSYTTLIISHLPSAVFSTIFIGLYAIILSFGINTRKGQIGFISKFALLGFIGTCLAGFYLYPAITLIKHTNSDYLWGGWFHYSNWFLAPYVFGECPIKSTCNLLSTIAYVQFLVPIVAFLYISKYCNQQSRKHIKALILLSAICLFLMTPLSILVWYIIEPLQKIQFPWRMLTISDFLYVAILTNLLAVQYSRLPYANLLKSCIILIQIALSITVIYYVTYTNIDYDYKQRLENNRLTDEHVPKNDNFIVSLDDVHNFAPLPLFKVIDGEAKGELIKHNPRDISFNVIAKNQTTIQIGQFYFIGWKVKINDNDITSISKIRDAKPLGQIELDIPAGTYKLSIVMDIMKEEKIGMIISLIGLIILFILLVALKINRYSQSIIN